MNVDNQRCDPADRAVRRMQDGLTKYTVPVEGTVIMAGAHLHFPGGAGIQAPELSHVRWGWDADGSPVDSGPW